MSNEQNKRNIGVQILLDSQKNQFESLLSAASLARKLEVQLQGLFIEEDNLIRAADLPLSREVSLWSAEERQITGESVHRILRAHARHQQKELERVATAKEIEFTFKVIRGEKNNWIKENINSSNILFVGGHDLTPKPFQSLKYCSDVTPPLISLFDGSSASEHAFKIALQIAEKNNKYLRVLLLANDSSTEELLETQLNIQMRNHSNISVSVESISKHDVISSLHKQRINMLIAPSDIEWAQDDERFEMLIYQINYPIVLVS